MASAAGWMQTRHVPCSLQLLALQGLTHSHHQHLHLRHCWVPSLWKGEGVGVLQCLVAGFDIGGEGYHPVGPGVISSCSSHHIDCCSIARQLGLKECDKNYFTSHRQLAVHCCLEGCDKHHGSCTAVDMHNRACTGRYIGSGWTKASFFLTARLNLLLLSSNSTISVE